MSRRTHPESAGVWRGVLAAHNPTVLPVCFAEIMERAGEGVLSWVSLDDLTLWGKKKIRMVKWQRQTQTNRRGWGAAVDVHHSVIVSRESRMGERKKGGGEAQRVSAAKITALSQQISADDVCVCVCKQKCCTRLCLKTSGESKQNKHARCKHTSAHKSSQGWNVHFELDWWGLTQIFGGETSCYEEAPDLPTSLFVSVNEPEHTHTQSLS